MLASHYHTLKNIFLELSMDHGIVIMPNSKNIAKWLVSEGRLTEMQVNKLFLKKEILYKSKNKTFPTMLGLVLMEDKDKQDTTERVMQLLCLNRHYLE